MQLYAITLLLICAEIISTKKDCYWRLKFYICVIKFVPEDNDDNPSARKQVKL